MPKVVDSEERRHFLAGIAAELIAEQGMEGATVREIARRAGATRGLVEYHFRNKHEMIELALDEINHRYLQREHRRTKGQQGLAALESRLHCLLPLSRETTREWRLRLRFWSANDRELRTIQRKRLAETRRLFQRDLEQAALTGEIPVDTDIPQAVQRLQVLIAGLSATAVVDTSRFDAHYLTSELNTLLQRLRTGTL